MPRDEIPEVHPLHLASITRAFPLPRPGEITSLRVVLEERAPRVHFRAFFFGWLAGFAAGVGTAVLLGAQ